MNGAVTPSASTLATPADAKFVPPFESGQLLLEKYRVERLIGTGGIGYVMSALNIGIEERVALKFLRPEFLSNAEAVRRFTTEARLAAKIQHPHVARVMDVGSLPAAGPFIVMDLLVGRDLNQVLHEDGPLPVELAVDYALQACEGLAAAHARRIVHRDVKPDNLFLTRQAQGPDIIKILDFGISKLRPDEFSDNPSAVQTNTALGSPSYMSPEQMRASSDIDGRADIWSLGCVLYELLTGYHAFDAPSVMQVCAVVLEQPPLPIGAYGKAIPAELERVILRCLEKDPALRFPDVGALAQALAPFAPHARSAEEHRSLASAWGYPKPPTSLLDALAEPFTETAVTEVEAAPLEVPSAAPWSAPPVAIEQPEPPSTRSVLLRVERGQRKRDYVTAAALLASVAALIVPSVRQQLDSARGVERARVASVDTQPTSVSAPIIPVEKIPVVPVTSVAAASAAPSDSVAPPPAQLLTDLPPVPPARAEPPLLRHVSVPPAHLLPNQVASAAIPALPVASAEAPAPSSLQSSPPLDAIESAALEVIPPASVEPGPTIATSGSGRAEPVPAAAAVPSASAAAALPAPTDSAAAVAVPAAVASALPAAPPSTPELVTQASPAPGSPSWASAGLVKNVAVAPLPTVSSRSRAEAPRRLSSQTVASVARTHTPAVRACLARAQLEPAELKGQLALTATLDPAGNVVSAKVAGASAPLASCLASSARRWKFPSQPGAAELTSYVLVFE